MKKPNINPTAIREFFVYHVEKLVFVGMILGLMVFAYGAIGRERLTFSPEDLEQATQNAHDNIRERSDESRLEKTNFIEVAKRVKIPIDKTPYTHKALWSPPLFPSKGLREQPTVLPFEELRGEAGFGAVSMKGKRGRVGNRRVLRGMRWVIITGLIPVMKQQNAFEEAFEDAQFRQPKQDVPSWVYFDIERAEMSSPDDLSTPQWENINEISALKRKDRWSTAAQSIVSDRFLTRVGKYKFPMAFPIPSLVEKKFGIEAAHPDAIPLKASELAASQNEFDEMEDGMEDGMEPDIDEVQPEDVVLPEDGESMFEGNFVPDGSGMMEGMEGMEGEYPGEDFLDPSGLEARTAIGRMEKKSPYTLFRFLDFTVEPGKFYRYRARPRLINPNYKVPIQHLVSSGSSVGTVIPPSSDKETGWAVLDKVIAVPRDARILAGPATISSNLNTKPKVNIGVTFFHMETGATEFDTFEVVRGQRLNFPERPLTEEPDQVMITQEEETEVEMVDFITDHTVVDIRGGGKLPGRSGLIGPSLILLMDPDGNLVVSDEMECDKEYQDGVNKRDKIKSKTSVGEMGPGMEGMEGYEESMEGLLKGSGMNPKTTKKRKR